MAGGTVTPIPSVPGTGVFLGIVPPLQRTHLSLARYARVLGCNPVHFWGGFGQEIWQIDPGCDDVWPRHSWQKADAVSHEELANAIKQAEFDLAKFIGYPLAPEWIARENHRFPQFYRKDYISGGMRDTRGYLRAINTNWKKVITPGRRATTLIASAATVTYTDVDADGFYETATVSASTSLTSTGEIKIYFAGTNADPRWEIRDVRSKTISGGTVTIKLDSWLLIVPEDRTQYPTRNGFDAVDVGDNTTHFVSTVDIYREYTDTTTVSAELYWESVNAADWLCASCGGSGCDVCNLLSQNGCLHIRDHDSGIVVPTAADYSSDESAWVAAGLSACRTPDQARIWYVAGNVSDDYANGLTDEPLDDYWATTIAYLATSRLEREFCGCGNDATLAQHLRVDIAFSGEGTSFLVDFGELKNIFGTRRGEIMAWHRANGFSNRTLDAALI